MSSAESLHEHTFGLSLLSIVYKLAKAGKLEATQPDGLGGRIDVARKGLKSSNPCPGCRD